MIFRGAQHLDSDGDGSPSTRPKGFRIIRTCLQEYTTFNSQASPAEIVLGSADMSLFPGATVHLQDLVLSEEAVPDQWGDAAAKLVSSPQRSPRPRGSSCIPEAEAAAAAATAKVEGRVAFSGAIVQQTERSSLASQFWEEYWYHVRYSLADEALTTHRGEFW